MNGENWLPDHLPNNKTGGGIMDRKQAKIEARRMLEGYLQRQHGIDTRKSWPCLNPEHTDSSPSMSLDRKHNRAHCFGCGASYDIFDLVALDYNLTDQREIFDKTYQICNLIVEDTPQKETARRTTMSKQKQEQAAPGKDVYTHTDTHTDTHTQPEADRLPYYQTCAGRIRETNYPESRGLSRETLERHMIGYDPNFRTKDYESGDFTTWQALIIPTGRGSFTARNTDPSAGKKNRYRNRGAAQIFNYKKGLYSSASPVFVVEGEIDALSIEEAGGAAVGLGSIDNIPLLLRMLEERRPSQPLILALDNDERGKEAEGKLIEGLERLRIPYTRLNPYGEYKDANEALVNNREAFSEEIRAAAETQDQAEAEARDAYMTTSAGAHIQEFLNGIAASANTDAIPTGFSALDKVLDGGLYEGLITVGAISSLGKTSLILQIADQIAAAGNDVLIMSLEMSRSQLMSKSISRHTLQIALKRGEDTRNAKTSRGITSGKRYANYSKAELQLIKDATGAYSEYADRIFIQEGVGNIGVEQIRETVERHILATGGKWETEEKTGERKLIGGRRPLLIVDYLQIIAPYNDRATDKQNTDKAVLELKRISRDYKISLLTISSLNRVSYKDAVTMEAFKESGAIEYSSDVLIGLQLKGAGRKDFDPTLAKKKDPREIELVILKNRDGAVGDKIAFSYFPMFNYFIEKRLVDYEPTF